MCEKYSPNTGVWWLKKEGCVECIKARIADCRRWVEILKKDWPNSLVYRSKAESLKSTAEELEYHLAAKV